MTYISVISHFHDNREFTQKRTSMSMSTQFLSQCTNNQTIRHQVYSTQIFPVSLVSNQKSSTQPEQKCLGTVFKSVRELSSNLSWNSLENRMMSGELSCRKMSLYRIESYVKQVFWCKDVYGYSDANSL